MRCSAAEGSTRLKLSLQLAEAASVARWRSCGDGWEQHVEGKKLKEIGDAFVRKLDTKQLFREWCESVTSHSGSRPTWNDERPRSSNSVWLSSSIKRGTSTGWRSSTRCRSAAAAPASG